MKCGTSSLYEYLSGHPSICPCITKEPEFFSENQGHRYPANEYSQLFSFDARFHQYALEASTGYTKYPSEPNVPQRIHDYGLQPKFIYVVRDPFERIESQYNFWHVHHDNLCIVDDYLVNISNYFAQLERFATFFSASNIKIIDFDDLRLAPSEVLLSIYKYLNLEYSYTPSSYSAYNRTELPRSRYEDRIEKLGLTQYLKKLLPLAAKQAFKTALRKTSSVQHRKLTTSEKDYVYSRLSMSMRQLHEVYGVDVSKWGFSNR